MNSLIYRSIFISRSVSRNSSLRRRRVPLLLEVLESRQLLATVAWTGSVSNSWNDALNWSDNRVPLAGDDVVIDLPNVTQPITIDSGSQIVNSLNCTDPLEIGGGTLTIEANSTISGTLAINNNLTIQGPMTLSGSDSWTAGKINGVGSITIANTAIFTLTSSTTLQLGTPLDNGGNVRIAAGNLSITAGGQTETESGIFDVASGSMLQIAIGGVGDIELNTGTQFLGSGLYELDLGTISVDADVSVANLTITGGTLNGPDTLTVTGALNWTGGTMDGSGQTTVASVGLLSIAGSNIKHLTGGHTLTNKGTGTWSGTGEIMGGLNSTFVNAGALTAQSDAEFGIDFSGAGTFNNTGTFTKSGTSGATAFEGNVLNNSGTVNIESGSLRLNAGFATQTETGIFNVAAGALLRFFSNVNGFSEGDFQLDAGTQLLGSGTYELDLGKVTVSADLSVANLILTTNGTLDGPGTLTITDTFNCTGGTLGGTGTTISRSGSDSNDRRQLSPDDHRWAHPAKPGDHQMDGHRSTLGSAQQSGAPSSWKTV